jgi:hypothetical protein
MPQEASFKTGAADYVIRKRLCQDKKIFLSAGPVAARELLF